MSAKRTDANQAQLVRLLRQLGCSVLDTHEIGHGAPDCFVAKHQNTVAVEIKDGAKSPSARALTPDEVAFRAFWKGRYVVVETEDDAYALADSLAGGEA